jgi:hypothetical protein
MKSLLVLLVGCLSALAVSAQQPPTFVLPTLGQVLGRTPCGAVPPAVEVHEQDPHTLFWSGRIYATTSCADADRNGDTIYRACAAASWDPTGTVVTFKVLWKETVRSSSIPEQKLALHRCLVRQGRF